MTSSTKYIQQKAIQHFILLILCCLLLVTGSIAWYKHHEVNQYQRNAPTINFDFIRRQYEKSENFRFYYTLATAISEHPLWHMLEAYWAYGISRSGYRGLKEFIGRCLS